MTNQNSSSTIRDVARLAGVSVATVSRFINQNAPLAEETQKRVQAAMDELHFIPHLTARNLATRRTNNIGLVVDNIGGEFFTPLLDGMVSVTQANDYNLLIFNGIKPGPQTMNRLGPGNTDGLMVFLESLDKDSLYHLSRIGHPIVLIHQTPPPDLDLPLVTIENKAGACKLVDHLIEVHGKKRIIYLRGPEGNEDSSWREVGYRESLEKHQIVFDEKLVNFGDYDRFVALKNLSQMIRDGIQFDAVFAADDDSAIGAMQALREAGIDVPGQVAVVGFDDQRLASFLNPSLTTIHAPTMQIGASAAENLLHLIRHEKVEPVTLLPTNLVIRNSCGCSST
jgi:DNA-binding LacI/PurR family transcriptional regulator